MERAMTTDHAIALGMAGLGLVLPGDLDRQLARFGAGIAEEHCIGKRVVDEPLC